MNSEMSQSRGVKITFRVANIILIVGMILGGFAQVFKADAQTEFFLQLGYPLYLMTMIGIAKIAGAIVLLLPRMPLLKVSAYTGVFIVTTSAFISHLIHGDAVFAISPFIVSCLAITACILNPNISFVQPGMFKPPSS